MFNEHILLVVDHHLLEHELLQPGDLYRAVASISHFIQKFIADVVPSKRSCQFSRVGWTPELIALRHKVTIAG